MKSVALSHMFKTLLSTSKIQVYFYFNQKSIVRKSVIVTQVSDTWINISSISNIINRVIFNLWHGKGLE